MIIQKKPSRPHGLNEPFRHENHPRPITRRRGGSRRTARITNRHSRGPDTLSSSNKFEKEKGSEHA